MSEQGKMSVRNERFHVEINAQNRKLTLRDLSLNASWISNSPFVRIRVPGAPEKKSPYFGFPTPLDVVDWKPDQLSCTVSGAHMSLRLSGVKLNGVAVELKLSIALERERVRFEVTKLKGLGGGKEVMIDFPYRLGSASPGEKGYLVVPRGAGILVDFSDKRDGFTFENFIYSGGQNGYSMPIYGTASGENILGAIIKTPFDAVLSAEINSGTPAAYAMSPCWLFEGGRLMGPRRVDYSAFRGGYVELAKWYRSDLMEEGRYKTLEEKAEGHPLVRNLPGAVLAEMRLIFRKDALGKGARNPSPNELVDNAKSGGFDRVVAYSVGIWQRPYHGTHAVPPKEGTADDLARGARYARSQGEGYDITVYENFIDMWPDTPGYDEAMMLKRRDGSIKPNWYSQERGTHSSTVCTVHRLETARRDLPGLKDIIGEGSIYVDVEGAINLMECFDPVHPMTREEDCKLRRELLSYTRDLFGSVATESMPIDCLADVVDVGAYFPVYQFIGYGCSAKPRITPPVIPIPLFVLVYHGSVINMTPSHGTFYTCDPLYVPLWGMLPDGFDDLSMQVSRELRDNCYASMDDHRFITGPSVDATSGYHSTDLQLSSFSDGTHVLANFSEAILHWEGKIISPKDFLIWKE